MKAIISLSGGLDSAVLLADTLNKGIKVETAVCFDYGSKHGIYEQRASQEIAAHYSVPWMLVNMTAVFHHFKSALLQSGGPIPEGHYAEDSMKQTVVPFRNGIFLSVLAGLAESCGADAVMIGAHAGDHHIYPDCRPDFLDAIFKAVWHGTEKHIRLMTPFEEKHKHAIVKVGIDLKVPFVLTRTCYAPVSKACGKCGSCTERREAFLLNGITDPIIYEHNGPLPMKGQS